MPDDLGNRPRIALLTASEWPNLYPDDIPLLDAFATAGWQAAPRQWRDSADGETIALIRSCWDYVEHHADFLESLSTWSKSVRLANPWETVIWNASKRYLPELAARGVVLPPTIIVEENDTVSLADTMHQLQASTVVVKPVVGAGGGHTWRTDRREDTRWEARGGAVIVQPFLPEIVTEGELSLIWLGNEYSHAVRKWPATGEFRVQSRYGGQVEAIEPSEAVRRQAEQALRELPHSWSYARVDGVITAGRFVVMEIELVEPELFFRFAPDAPARLVAAVLAA